MLFLFRSAPEVEKRIHSKLFRKFWRSRGTKEPAYITVLDKYFPEKTVNVTNLDKEWLSPSLKLLLRQGQRELFKNGKSEKYKKLRKNFRRRKRESVKMFYKNFVEELKVSKPSRYFQMLKKLGGEQQKVSGKLEIECLKDKSDQEGAEAVAGEFA